MRILVIDDDKLVAVSLKTILESDENIEVADIGYSGRRSDNSAWYRRETDTGPQ